VTQTSGRQSLLSTPEWSRFRQQGAVVSMAAALIDVFAEFAEAGSFLRNHTFLTSPSRLCPFPLTHLPFLVPCPPHPFTRITSESYPSLPMCLTFRCLGVLCLRTPTTCHISKNVSSGDPIFKFCHLSVLQTLLLRQVCMARCLECYTFSSVSHYKITQERQTGYHHSRRSPSGWMCIFAF
jgi:hypothetical protein